MSGSFGLMGVAFQYQELKSFQADRLCLLFIHPRAPNLISLRSAGTMPT